MSGTYRHLPPGRAAGRQSRADRRRRRTLTALALGTPALMLGLALYIYLARHSLHDGDKWAGYDAVLVGFTVIVFGLVWVLRWLGRPPRARHLRVELDRREVARGGSVVATLEVDRPSTVKGELQLGLISFERYDAKVRTWVAGGATGGSTVTLRKTLEGEVSRDWRPVAAQPSQSIELTVPHGSLCSFEGECISYAWRVSAREIRKRRRPRRADTAIWVLP